MIFLFFYGMFIAAILVFDIIGMLSIVKKNSRDVSFVKGNDKSGSIHLLVEKNYIE